MGRTSYNKQEWAQAGFSPFIVPEEVDAPYTTIVNRAKVKQPSLKGVMVANYHTSYVGTTGANFMYHAPAVTVSSISEWHWTASAELN